MARIDIKAGATILSDGLLQLENGAAMDTTLRSITDQNNTASQLKLASNATQVVGTLQITTNDNPYIDAEDGAGNNRFTIGRASSSQQVNVDFASNPTSATDAVGAFRTYANGVVLSEAMTFLRNGNVGVGTTAPTEKVHVYNTSVADLYLKIQTTQSRTSGVISQNSTANWFAGTQYSATNAYQVFDQTNNRLQLTMFNTGNSQFSTSNTVMGAKLGIQGSGSTSATTSLLVQNSAGQNALTVLDDKSTTMYGNSQVAVSNNGAAGNSNAYRMLIRSSDGFSFIDGWADNASKTGNYPMVFGSRSNKVGSDVTGATTQENGSPSIFGAAVWDISALVQINSTTRGFLPPRMTNAQRAAIATPAVGLMVYCTDAVEGLYVYKSIGWTFVI